MKLAEELYQTGFISYPRTETDSFEEGYDLLVSITISPTQEIITFAGAESDISMVKIQSLK